ncbi:cytochrome c oxidase assembly protein [Siminovitchia sediminis]|uniref:Cytochrome c oxidase assembly protein n=1 Tax=Siminovitchia sediminis TaxID=1274353 RepID=A0ABW4KGZ5_9BACI
MSIADFVLLLIFSLMVGLYITAGISSSKKPHLKNWPIYRYLLWTAGIASAAVSVIGPLAEQSHDNFVMHMIVHLLLGMLAPLLLVLSAPFTLVLRSLDRAKARKAAALLKSTLVRYISHPVTASFLNIGGLWILYTTELFHLMHQHFFIHALVHFHLFLAGYVFTAAMIYVDPVSHRFSYLYRGVVFIFALAGHQILAKYLYGHPPLHFPLQDVQAGAKLMYYGGDAIDLVIIYIFFRQWYQSARPRRQVSVI